MSDAEKLIDWPDNLCAERHEVSQKWVIWYLTDEQAAVCNKALKAPAITPEARTEMLQGWGDATTEYSTVAPITPEARREMVEVMAQAIRDADNGENGMYDIASTVLDALIAAGKVR